MATKDALPRTPAVKLMDRDRRAIFDQEGRELRSLLISFFYEYYDDEDDECQIVLQTNSILLADLPQIQADQSLIVGWGYVGESPWVYREISIRELRTKYLQDKIVLELSCTDCASYLKRMSESHNKSDQSFGDWVQDISEKTAIEIELENDGRGIYTFGTKEATLDSNNQLVTAIDNTAVARWTDSLYNPVQFNRSYAQVIAEKAQLTPGGPWYLDGRDCKLTIHNRAKTIYKDPIAALRYMAEDGEILTFVPEDKSKYKDMRKMDNTSVDPISGEVKVNSSYQLKNDPANDNSAQGKERANFILNSLISAYRTQKANGNLDTDEIRRILANNILTIELDQTSSPSLTIEGPNGKLITARDEARAAVRTSLPMIATIQTADIEDAARGIVENEIGALHQQNKPATMITIGETKYATRELVTVSGVAKVHEDEYYIRRVKHNINPEQGYKCEFELLGGIRESKRLSVELAAGAKQLISGATDNKAQQQLYFEAGLPNTSEKWNAQITELATTLYNDKLANATIPDDFFKTEALLEKLQKEAIGEAQEEILKEIEKERAFDFKNIDAANFPYDLPSSTINTDGVSKTQQQNESIRLLEKEAREQQIQSDKIK